MVISTKLTVILGLLTELATSAAILESIVFEGDSNIFSIMAICCLITVSIYCSCTRTSLQLTLLSSFLVSAMLAFQVSVSVSKFWHDALISKSACVLGFTDLSTLIIFGLLLLIDILPSTNTTFTRLIKLSFYLSGLCWLALQLYLAKGGSSLICGRQNLASYKDLNFVVYLLPLFYAMLCLITQKLKWQLSRPHLKLTEAILLLSVVATFCLGALQAWKKADYFREFSDQNQTVMNLPYQFVIPLLVAEDPIFFKHHGLDFSRLQEAVRETLFTGKFQRGGSTLTMQLFKVLYQDYEKTIWRKLVQILGAQMLELKFSKLEILNKYLQTISFGPGIIGLEQASRAYFNSRPHELSEEQALKLVVTVYNPTKYTPIFTSVPRDARLRMAVIKGRERELRSAISAGLKQNENLQPFD